MAKVAKIVAVAALTAVTGGVGGVAIGFSWLSFAGSLVLGGLSYALTPKPKKSGLDTSLENKGQTVAVRQPDITRQIIYGHTRITRGYAHMESTGLNGTLHVVLILGEGPLRAINEIWVNDYVIPSDWINEDGSISQGRYAGYLRIRKHLGTETQAADTLAVENMSVWTSDHKLSGIGYLYIIMIKNQDVYPTGVPNFSAVVEGPELYDPRKGTTSWSTNMALYANDFMRSDLYGFGALQDEINDTNIAAQANICDEIINTANLETAVLSVNITTNIISLEGDTLQYQFGDRVSLTTTGTLPDGLVDSEYYYVIPYQLKTAPRILLATSLDNAMQKIAVDFSSAGSGTITVIKNGEPRYHGGGVADSGTQLSQTLNDIVTCMAGRAVNIGGDWNLLAGTWRTPDISFGIGDIRGTGIGLKNSLSMGESYNIVKGLFISSVNQFQQTDYPSANYPIFIAQDNGLESIRDLNLPFTNRPTTAQRIAKIELFKGRQDIVYTSDFSMEALKVKPGDVVQLDIARLGWTNKAFEITEFSFNLQDNALNTRLTLRETAQQIYDWSAGEALDYDPAPNTDLPNPFIVFAVGGVFYNSREVATRDGDVVFTLTLNWEQHPDAFVVQFGEYEIQYKLSSEPDWRPSFFVAGALTKSDVLNSSVNIEYDVRIRAVNNLGVRSGWVTIEGVVTGSSGGIGTTYDWGSVTEVPPATFNDWGSVSDAPTAFEDWGYVV